MFNTFVELIFKKTHYRLITACYSVDPFCHREEEFKNGSAI